MKVHRGLVTVCLLVLGCTEHVTERYPTRSAAEADGLFKRGWLPEIIPTSSRQIVVSSDLDTNVSQGEFYFDPREFESFVAKLSIFRDGDRGSTPVVRKLTRHRASGYTLYSYVDSGSIWIFAIHRQRGHVYYVMEPNRTHL
jgi:hypothetical protein